MTKLRRPPLAPCLAALSLLLLLSALMLGLRSQHLRRTLRPAAPADCARFAQQQGFAPLGDAVRSAFGEGETDCVWVTNFSPQMRAADVRAIGCGVRTTLDGDGPCAALSLYACPAGETPETLSAGGALLAAEPLDAGGLTAACWESARPSAGLAPPQDAVLCFFAPSGPWEYTARLELTGPYTEEVRRGMRARASRLLRALSAGE